jgi:hypothetical protein
MDPGPRRLVTITEAATIAAVSTRTIRHWIRLGRVDIWRTVGGAPRVFVDSLFVAPDVHAPRLPPAARR